MLRNALPDKIKSLGILKSWGIRQQLLKLRILLTRFENILLTLFFLSIFFVPKSIQAQSINSIYVDGNLVSNCTSGNYSIANRNCNGKDGNAYKTIASGLSNITSGQTLYIRSGTYTENGKTIPSLGSFASMVVISAFQDEAVTWKNDTIYSATLPLSSNANNITVKNIHFVGKRYISSNEHSWEQYQSNVWRTLPASNPPAEVVEVKQGCDVNFICARTTGLASQTPERTSIAEVVSGIDGDFYQNYPTDFTLYVHSATNPGARSDIWETGTGSTVGGSSSGTGRVVIQNSTFDGNGHVHLKGGYQWLVQDSVFKNIGTDANDHHIYAWGVLTNGNEAIYERNYFVDDPGMGAAIHIYGYGYQVANSGPIYHIARYNIFQGKSFWAVAAWGSYLTIANNSIYMAGGKMGVDMPSSTHHDNTVVNNIFVGPIELSAIEFNSSSTNNDFENNIVFNATLKRTLNCTNCIIQNNYANTNPGWISTTPSTISDFHLKAGSLSIDKGKNLGALYQNGLDNNSSSWPIAIVNQNNAGSFWDIGAFVYNIASTPTQSPTESQTPTLTPTSAPKPGDANGDGIVNGIDYVIWLNHYNTQTQNSNADGDFNSDGTVDGIDYVIWLNNYS